jgi:ABC-type glycerol-3-phosphate transport system substrate-binding protein
MRRFYLAAIVISLFAMAVASSSAQEATRLRVHSAFGGSSHALWDRNMIDNYQALNPEVRIDYSSTAIYSNPVPLRSMESALTADQPADLFMGTISGAFLHRHIEEGNIADISELWEAEGWYDEYPQQVIDMASYEGKQYFLPMGFQWNPVFYNADVFAEHDIAIPETWEDLLETCTALNEAGIRPFTVSVADWHPPTARWFTMLNLRINGPEFHEALMAGEISWQDDAVRMVLEYWQEAGAAGCFGEDIDRVTYGGAVDELLAGDAAMYLLGEWLYESFQEGEGENIEFFRFPPIKPEYANAAIVHYYGAWIHADAEHPDEARELLKYLGTTEVQESIVTELGRAVMTNNLPDDVLPQHQQLGREFVRESTALAPLFEVSPFTNSVAVTALSRFRGFYGRLDDTEYIDIILDSVEEERREQIGES